MSINRDGKDWVVHGRRGVTRMSYHSRSLLEAIWGFLVMRWTGPYTPPEHKQSGKEER